MPPRPASITVLAILGILYGSFKAIALLASILMMLIFTWNTPNPMLDPFRHDTLYFAFSNSSTAFSLFLALLLISASAGSLTLRPWARRGMLLYAWLEIPYILLAALFSLTYVLPKMAAALPATAPATLRMVITFSRYSTAFGVLFSCILPVLILYFFTRPRTKDAFAGILPAAFSNFPVQFP